MTKCARSLNIMGMSVSFSLIFVWNVFDSSYDGFGVLAPCFVSFFIIFVANFSTDVFLGKYLAYFLKAMSILRCDFCCDIHTGTNQIFNVHGTILPIGWISIDAITESVRMKANTMNCIFFLSIVFQIFFLLTKLAYRFWFGKKCFCWSWMRRSCQRPMCKLSTWFQIW